MTSRRQHLFRFGRVREQAQAIPLPLTSLVDVLLATTGIVVVILSLPRADQNEPLVPDRFDIVLHCAETPGFALYFDPDRPPVAVTTSALPAALEEALPDGGRVLVLLDPPCIFKPKGEDTPRLQLESLSAQENALSAPYVFELAPTGSGALSPMALLDRWRADAGGRQ